ERVWGEANPSPYVKDGINACVVDGEQDAVNPAAVGTKAAARYRMTLAAGQSVAVRLRLANTPIPGRTFGKDFDVVFAQRLGEADEFYATVIPKQLSDDAKSVMRQAFAGLLWSKQFYHYYVRRWLEGDPAPDVIVVELLGPEQPRERLAHDALGIVRELLRDHRRVELVRLAQALGEYDVKVLAECAPRDRRVGEPQAHRDALPGGQGHPVARRRLRSRGLGVDRVLFPIDDASVDAVLHVRARVRLAPDPL